MNMKKEIFLVEDSPDFRQIARMLFTQYLPDYHIRSFLGAKELYQYMLLQSGDDYSGRRPVLIILDLNLERISGIELLRLIRQTPSNNATVWRHIPVVMLSPAANQEAIDKCYQAGASSFFVKPTDFDDLKKMFLTMCHYWIDYNYLASSASQTIKFS
jgi:CheY-like chemotaxis protein